MVKSTSIRSAVCSNVKSGRWKPGQRIPPEITLAREFGVCRVTVSNVLKELDRQGLFWSSRGKGRFVAENPEKAKTQTVGVLIQDVAALTDWWSMKAILEGINAEIAHTSYHLKILALNQNSDETANRDWLNLDALDGLIATTGSSRLASLMERNHSVPVVSVEDHIPGERVAIVELDWMAAAFAAIRHLGGLRHRRIAVLCSPASWRSGQQSMDGARMAAMEPGTAPTLDLRFYAAANSLEEGRRLGRMALEQRPPPTAVFCTADELALGVYQAARETGLSVPDHLSLITCGDRITPEQVPVAMTACRLDFKEVGKTMVKTLCGMIANPSERPPPTRIPVELVARESTRAVREQ